MSEIAVYKEKVSIEISQALESSLAKDMTDSSLEDFILAEVSKAFAVTGYGMPTGKELSFFINEVMRDIRQICKSFALRRDEISIAFNRGVRKEYGDFVGLPIVRFDEFLKRYCAHNDRMIALAERHAKAKEIKLEPTEEQKFNLSKDLALKAFQETKEGKDISLYARSVYDFLDGLGKISFSAAEKKEFFNQAKMEVIQYQQAKLTTAKDVFDSNKIKKVIEGLVSGSELELVKAKAKGIALTEYFQGLILEDKELF